MGSERKYKTKKLCIVFGCNSTKEDDVIFHQFPKDPKYCKIWTERIRRLRPSWLGPSPGTKICSAHFEPTQYHGYLYRMFGIKRALRLLPTAIPTYFPGGVYMAIEKELLPELPKTEIKMEKQEEESHQDEAKCKEIQLMPKETAQVETEGISGDHSTPVSAVQGEENSDPSIQSGGNDGNLDRQNQNKSLKDERNVYRLPPVFPAPNLSTSTSPDSQNLKHNDQTSYEKNKSLTIVTQRMDEINSQTEKRTTNIWQQNRVSGNKSGQYVYNQQGQLIAIEPTVFVVSMVQMVQHVQPLPTPEVPKTTNSISSGGSHSEVSHPQDSQTEGAQLEGSRPEDCQQKGSQPGGIQRDGSELEVSQLEGSQPEESQPKGSQLEGPNQLKSTQLEQSQPEGVQQEDFQLEDFQFESSLPKDTENSDIPLECHQPEGSKHTDTDAPNLGTDQNIQNLLPIETLEHCSDVQIDEILASVLSPIDKGKATQEGSDMLYIPESFVEGVTVKCEGDPELSKRNAENGSDLEMPWNEQMEEVEEIKEVKLEQETEDEADDEEEEEEGEEEEEEEEEDAWEMKDHSSDEDYVPEVEVKKRSRGRKLQNRRAAKKSTTDKNQNEPQDGDDKTTNGEDPEASEDNMSSSDSEYASDSEDSDEIEKRERRAQRKKTYSRPLQVRLEVKLAKLPKLFECKTCFKKMKDPNEMKTHYAETHDKKPMIVDKENQNAEKSCSLTTDIAEVATELTFCKKCQEFVKNIREHHASHRRRPYVCDVCGKVVCHKASFEIHLMRHERTGQVYPCKLCSRSYNNRGSLISHTRTVHTNNHGGKQICDKCGKSFVSKKSLNIHKSIHLEEKPHKCEVCGRGFSQRSNMVHHLRVHTGFKPYKCDICEEAFNHNVSLKTHQKKAHKIDWWLNNKNKKAKTS